MLLLPVPSLMVGDVRGRDFERARAAVAVAAADDNDTEANDGGRCKFREPMPNDVPGCICLYAPIDAVGETVVVIADRGGDKGCKDFR